MVAVNTRKPSLRAQHDAGISRTHVVLRRPLFALMLTLTICGEIARAENDSPSPEVVVSPCRWTAGFAAFTHDPKTAFGMRKGGQFARTAVLHMNAGDYERAFAQFDHAIS